MQQKSFPATVAGQGEAETLLDPVPVMAKKLGWTEPALRMKVHRHQIPFVRVGRRIFFDPIEIGRWITRCSSPASNPSCYR